MPGFPLARRRAPRPIRATPMKLLNGKGYTVFFETPEGFGAVGWGLTKAEAKILSTKIESGERPL